jgi:hypothetical protein
MPQHVPRCRQPCAFPEPVVFSDGMFRRTSASFFCSTTHSLLLTPYICTNICGVIASEHGDPQRWLSTCGYAIHTVLLS